MKQRRRNVSQRLFNLLALLVVVSMVVGGLLASVLSPSEPTPTPSRTLPPPAPTGTSAPTSTATPTVTLTNTLTPTATLTETATPTLTVTVTLSATVTPIAGSVATPGLLTEFVQYSSAPAAMVRSFTPKITSRRSTTMFAFRSTTK